jgi:hypothetical protein
MLTSEIINNLQARGESKEFIEGYLAAIASSLTGMSLEESHTFLQKTLEKTTEGNFLKANK